MSLLSYPHYLVETAITVVIVSAILGAVFGLCRLAVWCGK